MKKICVRCGKKIVGLAYDLSIDERCVCRECFEEKSPVRETLVNVGAL
jgi:NMD protein affecting ribosome stability and mRNA decay